MLKTVREVLAKRKEINDEDDYNVEKSRERLIELLSQDEAETISILNQLNELEVLYTSEALCIIQKSFNNIKSVSLFKKADAATLCKDSNNPECVLVIKICNIPDIKENK